MSQFGRLTAPILKKAVGHGKIHQAVIVRVHKCRAPTPSRRPEQKRRDVLKVGNGADGATDTAGHWHVSVVAKQHSFTSGCGPAPIHLMEGLPEEWAVGHDVKGRITSVKPTIISGFVRGDDFYTREQAAKAGST